VQSRTRIEGPKALDAGPSRRQAVPLGREIGRPEDRAPSEGNSTRPPRTGVVSGKAGEPFV
jgi:hypothetical protein